MNDEPRRLRPVKAEGYNKAHTLVGAHAIVHMPQQIVLTGIALEELYPGDLVRFSDEGKVARVTLQPRVSQREEDFRRYVENTVHEEVAKAMRRYRAEFDIDELLDEAVTRVLDRRRA